MMTEELRISVLSAPLAAIDRRALSQAWYSALHYAHASGCVSLSRDRSSSQKRTPPAQRTQRSGARASAVQSGTVRPRPQNGAQYLRSAGMPVERRAARLPLARDIERAFFEPRTQRRRATLIVGSKRVHVTVAADSGGVRFVAVCAPSVKSVVARALAQARFALAARRIPCF